MPWLRAQPSCKHLTVSWLFLVFTSIPGFSDKTYSGGRYSALLPCGREASGADRVSRDEKGNGERRRAGDGQHRLSPRRGQELPALAAELGEMAA